MFMDIFDGTLTISIDLRTLPVDLMFSFLKTGLKYVSQNDFRKAHKQNSSNEYHHVHKESL